MVSRSMKIRLESLSACQKKTDNLSSMCKKSQIKLPDIQIYHALVKLFAALWKKKNQRFNMQK